MTDRGQKPKYMPSHYYAGVAQLARASACHAEGREFESLHPLHFFYNSITLRQFGASHLVCNYYQTYQTLLNSFENLDIR